MNETDQADPKSRDYSKPNRMAMTMGVLLVLAAVALVAAAVVEPAGADELSPGTESMGFVQENADRIRSSHVLWGLAGAFLLAAGLAWLSTPPARAGPSGRLAMAVLAAGGLMLLAASAIVAFPMTDAALAGDTARFDGMDGAVRIVFPLGLVSFLVGIALLWAMTRAEGQRVMPKWAHITGAIAAGLSAVGIFGAAVLRVEVLGMLALPTLVVPIFLVWHGVALIRWMAAQSTPATSSHPTDGVRGRPRA